MQLPPWTRLCVKFSPHTWFGAADHISRFGTAGVSRRFRPPTPHNLVALQIVLLRADVSRARSHSVQRGTRDRREEEGRR